MSDTDVLIAGAGPTGLVLALWLQRLGVRVRIVDKVAEPGTTSRALVVHARILELYHQIGIAEAVAATESSVSQYETWRRGSGTNKSIISTAHALTSNTISGSAGT